MAASVVNATSVVGVGTPAAASASEFSTLSAHVDAVSALFTTGIPYCSQNFVA